MTQVPCKVFVGRCTEDIQADDLRDYFSTFGEVTDVFIPKPFRAFAFVTFLDPEVAQNLCGEDHIIKGVSVHVSNAAPKSDPNGRLQGGGGGMGGYRGSMIRDGTNLSGHHGNMPYQQQGSGGWNQGSRNNIDMPNLQALGITGQGGGADGQNPLNMGAPLNLGAVPMNTALMAAALNQAGWSLVGGLQGNQGPGGGFANQSNASGYGGPQQGGGGPAQGGPNTGQGGGGILSWGGNRGSGNGNGQGGAPQQQGSWPQRGPKPDNYLS
ncbi:hypothetical protein PR048_029142 [Dryococelus australis]|uniref:RRM domain-containing protein n=1 Tax=Dryococelus australis TaxID=614101 RepID=A0ABQ9GCI8_9NEOP|nr:hypothetical protein PR048_029142 [Dryococelus australis]